MFCELNDSEMETVAGGCHKHHPEPTPFPVEKNPIPVDPPIIVFPEGPGPILPGKPVLF
jgi:hypothetical protein